MRKTTPMTFGQLWEDFLAHSPAVAGKIAQAKAVRMWPSVAGPVVAYHTASVNVAKGVMYVRITSASARSEVFMRRSELVDAINKELGSPVLRTLVVK